MSDNDPNEPVQFTTAVDRASPLMGNRTAEVPRWVVDRIKELEAQARVTPAPAPADESEPQCGGPKEACLRIGCTECGTTEASLHRLVETLSDKCERLEAELGETKKATAPVTVSEEMIALAMNARWGAMDSIGGVLSQTCYPRQVHGMVRAALECALVAVESARGAGTSSMLPPALCQKCSKPLPTHGPYYLACPCQITPTDKAREVNDGK